MSGTDILPKTLPLNEQIHIYALHLMLFKENELKNNYGAFLPQLYVANIGVEIGTVPTHIVG